MIEHGCYLCLNFILVIYLMKPQEGVAGGERLFQLKKGLFTLRVSARFLPMVVPLQIGKQWEAGMSAVLSGALPIFNPDK